MAYQSKLDIWNKERDTNKSKFDKSFSTTDRLNDYKKKLEETFKSPSSTLHDWDNFKTDMRKRLNSKNSSTPKLSPFKDFTYLKSPTPKRQQASTITPIDRYKLNSDLLYKNLIQTRPSSPPVYASSLATSSQFKLSNNFLENRMNTISRSTKSKLQAEIKLNEISKLQKVLEDLSDSDMKSLSSTHIEALHSLAEVILKKTRDLAFIF